MADKIIYPQVSGANWPSTVLHAWLTLHGIGVPPENPRFMPEIAHFASPEVIEEEVWEDPIPDHPEASLRHPKSPRYDRATGRANVDLVDPEAIRPRLKVNVRAETMSRLLLDDMGATVGHREEVVGRLAHFMEPMMLGMTDPARGGVESDDLVRQKPITQLTRQVAERYPELMATIPAGARDMLEEVMEALEKAVAEPDPEARRRYARQAAQVLDGRASGGGVAAHITPRHLSTGDGAVGELAAYRAAFLTMAEKLAFDPEDGISTQAGWGLLSRFKGWADALFLADSAARARETEAYLDAMDDGERSGQHLLVQKLLSALTYENHPERERIVRDLMEILTTEVFTSVAMIDYMWGLAWIHGAASAYRENPGPVKKDGVLMSVMGGVGHRTLLLNLLQEWAGSGGALGVGQPPEMLDDDDPPADCLDARILDEAEQMELWSLVAWRREAVDPLVLMETAMHRLLHPDASIEMRHFKASPGRFDTLFAQPGATATLGGRAKMLYPGVVIRLPYEEDADDDALRAKGVLKLLVRLFLPVCFHVEIVWREAVARLDRPSYLVHEFQQGIRLADPWAALTESAEDSNDPLVV